MKKIKTISLIGLFAVFVFASCNIENSNKTKHQKEKKITVQEVKNPNNPYDKVGRVHNEFLTYVGPKLQSLASSGQTDISTDQIMKWIKGFYKKKNLTLSKKQQAAYDSVFGSLIKMRVFSSHIYPPTSAICEHFPWVCEISGQPGQNSAWPLPWSLLEQEGQNDTENTLDFIAAVKKLETKANNMPDSTQKLKMRKRGILTRYVVARYSIAFWHNAIYVKKDNSPYNVFISKRNDPPAFYAGPDVFFAPLPGGLNPKITRIPPSSGSYIALMSALYCIQPK